MSPELLPSLAVFERVARHASFTRAATELGLSPSAVSQSMRSLESRLGVRLLNRSTRRVGVTEIGQRLLLDAQPALAALTRAVEDVNDSRDQPIGVLRLNLSRTAADLIVVPHLADFLEAYPDVTVELACDNALIDLARGDFDAGIRFGKNLAQEVVAVPLGGRQRLATVAAPRYLDGRTAPRKPEDLHRHRCVNVRLASGLYRWEYERRGQAFEIETSGPLVTNDGDTALAAVLAGCGIGCAFEVQVRDALADGRLVPLLKPWWPALAGLHLYFSSRQQVPRKLRVFVDFMKSRLAGP